MERGLLWFPLLAVFCWLAWSGWNEYQKLEAYRRWAEQFDRAKYDIYAVLGQKNSDLTWGIPTRQGPVNQQSFSLQDVQSISLVVDSQEVDCETPPSKGRAIALKFILAEPASFIQIPFTEIPLAARWGNYLQQELKKLHQDVAHNREQGTGKS
ncbi:hypothetical protein [Lyngbya aestuarii]|uniref:hypothetical protein n=1 Tax=Lyngbya aestuarii TaxID=118322 RepID=UPI00403D8BE7